MAGVKILKHTCFWHSYDDASNAHGCRWPHAGSTAGRYQPAGRSHGTSSAQHCLHMTQCLICNALFPPYLPCFLHVSPLQCWMFLVCRPSRWPCRQWTWPNSRQRSSRRRRKRRREGDGAPGNVTGKAPAPPPLHLPHLPDTSHVHLKARPATEGLNQRYFIKFRFIAHSIFALLHFFTHVSIYDWV